MSRPNDCYSYPLRGMDRLEASRYIGVGVTKFDEMVADRRMPRPRRVDGRNVWDRVQLDAAFSDLPYREVNQIEEALARGEALRQKSGLG